jgi:hypothetical protein
MHVHSTHATVLASLADSRLPAIDQNAAAFFNRHVVDEGYAGLAFADEGERCDKLLADPKDKVMVMGKSRSAGNRRQRRGYHRLFYFERAAEIYIKPLWTGRPLRTLSDPVAEKVAREMDRYPDRAERHFAELKAILEAEEPEYDHRVPAGANLGPAACQRHPRQPVVGQANPLSPIDPSGKGNFFERRGEPGGSSRRHSRARASFRWRRRETRLRCAPRGPLPCRRR